MIVGVGVMLDMSKTTLMFKNTKYRYIKQEHHGSNWDNWKRFGYIKVLGRNGNVSTGKTVTADFTPIDTNYKETGQNVNDWVNKSTQIIGHHSNICNLTVDLGGIYEIRRIVLYNWLQDGRYVYYKLYGSIDNKTWDLIYDTTISDNYYKETSNGKQFYTYDFKNLCVSKHSGTPAKYVNLAWCLNELLEKDTKYTVQIKNNSTEEFKCYLNEGMFEGNGNIRLTIPSGETKKVCATVLSKSQNTIFKAYKDFTQPLNIKVVMIKGDWTEKDIPTCIRPA